MKPSINLFLLALLCSICQIGFGQCADSLNIYTFEYNGHFYEVVKEGKTWNQAAECAVERGGYLAEINDEEEQNAIFVELTANADIDISNTENQFGTASIWLGGSDAGTEGTWIWDGNNDGLGPEFWMGGPNGSPINDAFTNWGISPAEPDNSGGQDHLTIIIKPTATNFGLWNDLIATNPLYYLIEYDLVLSTSGKELKNKLRIFPNPFNTNITIDNQNTLAITNIQIFNLLGQKVKTALPTGLANQVINVSDLETGVYVLQLDFENGKSISQKIVK